MTPPDAEAHRQDTLERLREIMLEIDSRGMAFQDEQWWAEYCAFTKKFREYAHDDEVPPPTPIPPDYWETAE